ncbi:probable adenylate kinase 7, mitochondrial [Ananas comosus]|uniref:adenylate kinase n=1 Tax=Ananas comosus TaxID=4615 RepID=A0A6P5EZC2_ANACO|nr:probable adenylate kinase 7, mitochondrial [Ananas comosus]
MAGILRSYAARSLARRVRGAAPAPPRRRFSAAAVAVEEEEEIGYWTEWEEEEEAAERERRRRAADADALGERGRRGVQWVFMGSPGAQRHAHAARLAELLAVPYISMGTLVRQELNPRSCLYKKIANSVNEGKLVPEDIIFGLLTRRLEEAYHSGETGFILDGIPRTRLQAEILDQITKIDLVVNFKCIDDCLVKKKFGSDICSHCRKPFDARNSESTSLNPCLATRTRHAQLKSSTAVDLDDSRVEKIRIYSEQSKLLEEYYRKQKKLLDIQVSGGPGETWRGLLEALRLEHIEPAPSPHKLTV